MGSAVDSRQSHPIDLRRPGLFNFGVATKCLLAVPKLMSDPGASQQLAPRMKKGAPKSALWLPAAELYAEIGP